jgi:RNA polymerase sigma factor (sigma-70 family)
MAIKNDILAANLLAEHIDSKQLNKLVLSYLKCKDPDKKEELRNQIFDNCIRFVRKITLKFVDANSEFLEDAFQTACVHFFTGLDKFNPKKNVSFLTYIYFWIVKGINEEFYSRSIINIKKDAYKGDRFKSLKNSSILDIHRKGSTDPDSSNLTLEAKIADSRNNMEQIFENKEMMAYLLKLADSSLSDIEKCVLKIRYFYDEQPHLHEIAEAMGISRQGVNQTEKRAFKKIKDAIQNIASTKKKNYSKNKLKKVELNENSAELFYQKIMGKRRVKNPGKRARRRR